MSFLYKNYRNFFFKIFKFDNHIVAVTIFWIPPWKLFCLIFIFLIQEVAQECENMNWGTFKILLTDALIDHLQPIQVSTSNMMP